MTLTADTGLTATDFFCGMGGSSTGLTRAGFTVDLAANHWGRAIISLGLEYDVDIGACTVHLDDFRAVRLATVATPLQVSQFVQDDVYFALSGAVDSAYNQNALMLVYYTSPDEDPTCSN